MYKLIVIIILSILISCTDNQRTKHFGGTQTIKLEPNEKFVNLTWKKNNLWIIVQDTITGIYYAREKSSFGVLEGKIIIQK